MKKSQRSVWVYLVTYWFVFPAPAAAYLDPGTGGMMVQALVAVVAAVVALVGTYWRALRDLVRRLVVRKRAAKRVGEVEP